MASTFLYSPAHVVSQLLIDLGLGTNPDDGGSWPIRSAGEIDKPDNCITVYDTNGTSDGRSMINGEVWGHNGFQVRVRSTTHEIGWAKADEIWTALGKSVRLKQVAIGNTRYLIYCINRIGDILALGKESPVSKRSLFTINAVVQADRFITITDDLFAYYRFDNDLTDSSGNARDLVGTPAYTGGLLGTGGLDGSSGNLVYTGGADFDVLPISVSLWFFCDTIVGTKIASVSPISTGGQSEFSIGVQSFLSSTLRVIFSAGGGLFTSTAPLGSLALHTWHHVVLTEAENGDAVAYLNGSVLTSGHVTPLVPIFNNINTPMTNVAGQLTMDEVGIWRRVLSQADVTKLYNGGIGFDPTA